MFRISKCRSPSFTDFCTFCRSGFAAVIYQSRHLPLLGELEAGPTTENRVVKKRLRKRPGWGGGTSHCCFTPKTSRGGGAKSRLTGATASPAGAGPDARGMPTVPALWLRGDASEKGARVHGGLLVRTGGHCAWRPAGGHPGSSGGGGEAAQG